MEYSPKKLQIARKNRGKTQQDIADLFEWQRSNVSKKEGGEPISTRRLQEITEYLECDLSEFYKFDGKEEIFAKERRKHLKEIERLKVEIGRLNGVIQGLQMKLELPFEVGQDNETETG